LTSFVREGVAALEDFADGIAELNPPEELQDLQDRTVSAMRAGTDVLNDVVSDLGNTSTMQEAQTILAEAPAQQPFDSMAAVCFEAQAMADDAGVDVDYDCAEE
jgi:hypothetical protein